MFTVLGESAVCQGLDSVLRMISISDIVNHDVLILMSFTDLHSYHEKRNERSTATATLVERGTTNRNSLNIQQGSHLAADIVNIFSAHSLVDFHKVKRD